MLKVDDTGRGVLQFESTGVIRRIPLERRGHTKGGKEWILGGSLLEVGEEGVDGSAQLYLITFNEELIEQINVIGVGKHVRVKYHIETKEYYDSFRVSVILDEIVLMTDAENFLIGKGKK
ncbi:MAG: hypothetical protein IIZ29_02875 [Schwartzia sp.]|nr:hypothetical protein [Schwartzia sp. (in: firmicutes)]